MLKTALVLFAHGARDPDWALPIRRVAAAVRAQAPDLHVEVAFLEFMAPALEPCIEALLAEGCKRIVILPMFIAQGGHLKRDLPVLADTLRARHPRAEIALLPPVGEADAVVRAMAAHAVDCVGG